MQQMVAGSTLTFSLCHIFVYYSAWRLLLLSLMVVHVRPLPADGIRLTYHFSCFPLYGIFFVYVLNSYFLGEGLYYVKSIWVTMWNWGYLPHYTT